MRPLKNDHFVHDTHFCNVCLKIKQDGVNFKVRFYKDKTYVSSICNGCQYDRYVGRRSRLVFKKKVFVPKPKTKIEKRVAIKDNIKEYFHDNR